MLGGNQPASVNNLINSSFPGTTATKSLIRKLLPVKVFHPLKEFLATVGHGWTQPILTVYIDYVIVVTLAGEHYLICMYDVRGRVRGPRASCIHIRAMHNYQCSN